MKTPNFTTTILVNQSPKEVFSAINNVRVWWPEIEGSTENLNDEFVHHYEDAHRCKLKIVEIIPDKKVVWLVLDNYFNFIKNKTEWIGTKMIFEISTKMIKPNFILLIRAWFPNMNVTMSAQMHGAV